MNQQHQKAHIYTLSYGIINVLERYKVNTLPAADYVSTKFEVIKITLSYFSNIEKTLFFYYTNIAWKIMLLLFIYIFIFIYMCTHRLPTHILCV